MSPSAQSRDDTPNGGGHDQRETASQLAGPPALSQGYFENRFELVSCCSSTKADFIDHNNMDRFQQ
jgi:hypothetical protein